MPAYWKGLGGYTQAIYYHSAHSCAATIKGETSLGLLGSVQRQ